MVENGRGWWHFSSPKEASYIASSITLSYPSPPPTVPLLISMPFCILGRHCSVAREYAVRLKARKAIVAVERRAKKKSPFSFSRCKLVHSYTLFAECFRSIQRRVGFDRRVFWGGREIRGSWNWKIWGIETDLLYFSRKFRNLNVFIATK